MKRYRQLKEEAIDLALLRTRLARGCGPVVKTDRALNDGLPDHDTVYFDGQLAEYIAMYRRRYIQWQQQ